MKDGLLAAVKQCKALERNAEKERCACEGLKTAIYAGL
jgi:hypothetical protein